jgi:hypothetical protein
MNRGGKDRPKEGITPMRLRLTTAVAAAAIIGMPLLSSAQDPQQQRQQHEQQHEQRTDEMKPKHHLEKAKQSLDQIQLQQLEGEARQHVQQIQNNFRQLEQTWQQHEQRRGERPEGTTGVTEQQRQERERPETERQDQEWMRHYQQIAQSLNQLLGPDPTARPDETVGTAGERERETLTDVELDANTRMRLQEFRTHLNNFYRTAQGMPIEQRHERREEHPTTGATGTTGITTPERYQDHREVTRVEDQRVDPESPEYHLDRLQNLVREAMQDTTGIRHDERPVGTTGEPTPGTVTVDRAKLEQMQQHIEQLRRLIDDNDRQRRDR